MFIVFESLNFTISKIQFLPHRKHNALHKKDKQVMGDYGNNRCLLYVTDPLNMTADQSVKFCRLNQDGRCTCEIKCRIAMAKAAFNKKRALFTGTLDLELRKKLVKCYVWSIALYGAETLTLRAVD